MRLAEGLFIDEKLTFGDLKFSALRRENMVEDEEGNPTAEVKSRTYDLKSRTQGMMIQVTIPVVTEDGEIVDKKEFDYDAPVKLVNPTILALASADFRGATVEWYLKADDLVKKDEKTDMKTSSDTTAGTVNNASNAGTPDAKNQNNKK